MRAPMSPGERNEDVPASASRSGSGPATVSVIGTLAEFRPEPVPYDLGELVSFVEAIGPDLLCLDMTLEQWQRRDFGGLPFEYRDALLPLATQTDIVVVPIGDAAEPGDREETGEAGAWGSRGRYLRSMLARIQRGMDTPVAVGEGWRHLVAETLLHLLDHQDGGPARRRIGAHRDALVERIVELARREPERRILVVVNARHCHRLRQALRAYPEVALVRHSSL